jgi:hypothetical protein
LKEELASREGQQNASDKMTARAIDEKVASLGEGGSVTVLDVVAQDNLDRRVVRPYGCGAVEGKSKPGPSNTSVRAVYIWSHINKNPSNSMCCVALLQCVETTTILLPSPLPPSRWGLPAAWGGDIFFVIVSGKAVVYHTFFCRSFEGVPDPFWMERTVKNRHPVCIYFPLNRCPRHTRWAGQIGHLRL